MKVYVIMANCCGSEPYIEKICSTPEKAQEYIRNIHSPYITCFQHTTEEWDVD